MSNILDTVANMASYAISSRLILVIHGNIINRTNHIVEHVFVDISRSHGCKDTTCHFEKIVYFSRVKTVEEKEEKWHRRMNRRYIGRTVDASVGVVGTLQEASSEQTPSDEPTVHLLVVPDDCQKTKQRRRKHRMNRRSMVEHCRSIRWSEEVRQ
jgi:hypothetical protein